jgi:ABC-type Fe3+-hydroxamate transport system substrate-binding protein
MGSYTDQLGRAFELSSTPTKIVSLVPSQTELLFDMGLEDAIVGITKFCVHPYHFKSVKQIVGGTKKVNLSEIAALKPDIILCNKEENTKEMIEDLEKIAPVHISDVATIDACLELIEQYGQLFSRRVEADVLSRKIRSSKADFVDFMKLKTSLKVAYYIWRNPWMVAGGGTFINELLELNKFVNIYGHLDRYPEVDIEKMRLEGDPELILLSSEPFPFKEEHAFELGRFTHHAKVIFVDGEYFSWYGSRLYKAFDYFKKLHSL